MAVSIYCGAAGDRPSLWRHYLRHTCYNLDPAIQLCTIHPLLNVAGLGTPAVLYWYSIWFNTVGQLSHCNIDTKCGWLNYIFNMPENHRFYHSRKIYEANSNYGQVLIIWDIAFGTLCAPSEKTPPSNIGDKFFSSAGMVSAGMVAQLCRPFVEMAKRRKSPGHHRGLCQRARPRHRHRRPPVHRAPRDAQPEAAGDDVIIWPWVVGRNK